MHSRKYIQLMKRDRKGEHIYKSYGELKHLEFAMAIKNLHSFGWECEQTFLQFKHQYIYIW